MKRSDLELWLELGQYGKPEAEARFALWVKDSLSSKAASIGLSKEAQESILWHHDNCIEAMTLAGLAEDGNFFRILADGYDALKKSDSLTKRDPASFLFDAYFACAKERN
jgi:hypothetical protein